MGDPNPTATVTVHDGVARVDVGGYISDTGAEVLAPAVAAAAAEAQIVVAFAVGSMINSAGIAVLLDLLLPLRDAGMDIRIVHPSAHFRRVFAIVGLAAWVPVYESLDSALAAP